MPTLVSQKLSPAGFPPKAILEDEIYYSGAFPERNQKTIFQQAMESWSVQMWIQSSALLIFLIATKMMLEIHTFAQTIGAEVMCQKQRVH